MKKIFFLLMCVFFLNAEMMKDTQSGLDDNYTYGNADLKGIFLDNSVIKTPNDKPLMLIFGQDGCYYCKLLTKNIKSSEEIKDYIKNNFSAFYINVSREKRHKVDFLQLEGITSKDYARLYNLTSTPLIIFIDTNGDVIMKLQGYPGDKVLVKVLDYISHDRWKVYTNEQDRVRGFMDYAQINSQ